MDRMCVRTKSNFISIERISELSIYTVHTYSYAKNRII